ncbi:M23 family metallopeptidase [Sedimentibacter sp.]|uniref:M23 family metallopeptidase n=1 Tax=Sedimentibacter sp. TaxID=1960295 RepID=UPI002898A105|nr:M23 family metallopeptidase [Sedimentibacter sp.]
MKNKLLWLISNIKVKKNLIIFMVTVLAAIGITVIRSLYVPAYEITINGENIGAVADTSVFEQTVDSVETQVSEILGEEYKLDSNVEMSKALVPKERLGSSDEMKDSLLNKIDKINKSYILTVDGVIIGASEDKSLLQGILDKIVSKYTNENTTYYQFEQDVSITYDYVAASTQNDLEAIYEILASNKEEAVSYTVVKGDTFSEIAANNGMRLSELMELNPQVEIDRLKIGDVLNIKASVPFLSVKTTENITYTEEIESPIEYVDDASLYVGESRTMSEGTTGTSQINADVTYLNGREIGRNVIKSTTLAEPTKTVIAKGTAPRPVTASYGKYIWPVLGKVTSALGSRYIFGGNNYHRGLDIAAPYGTDVKASDGGSVTFSGWSASYGNLVIITHDNGTQTYYAHNSSLLVSEGEKVYRGQAIAKVGSTGQSTGNHSHFEVRVNGVVRNPYDYLYASR